MSKSKDTMKIDLPRAMVNREFFANTVDIESRDNQYLMWVTTSDAHFYFIDYEVNAKKPITTTRELVISPKYDKIVVTAMHTTEPDVIIELFQDIIGQIRSKKNFRNPDGFIKLYTKPGYMNTSNVEISLTRIEPNDEFIQGLLMLFHSSTMANTNYNKNTYRHLSRINTNNAILQFDPEIFQVDQQVKIYNFFKEITSEYAEAIAATATTRLANMVILLDVKIPNRRYPYWWNNTRVEYIMRRDRKTTDFNPFYEDEPF